MKPNHPLLEVAGSAYTVNLYPNPTAPLLPLYSKSPGRENRWRRNLTSARALDRHAVLGVQVPAQPHLGRVNIHLGWVSIHLGWVNIHTG
jgi:hypothetical protein